MKEIVYQAFKKQNSSNRFDEIKIANIGIV